MNFRIKRFLIGLVLLLLTLPLLQWLFRIPQPSLKGVFEIPAKPAFSFASWFDGTWQEQYVVYYEKNLGFRPYLIGASSQIEYELFRQTKAWCTIGNDDYLFEPQYITSYLGDKYRGTAQIASDVQRLEYIQQQLKQMGKHLLVVLAPGKADIYPEKIPDSFEPWIKNISNYDGYAKALSLSNIPYIDFNADFKNKRQEVNYPLYTKYGIHWSEYASAFCADSIAAAIDDLITNKKCVRLHYDGFYESNKRLASDYDMMLVLNLLWLPEKINYRYHQLSANDTLAYKPNILMVADSYYWTIIGNGSAGILFSPESKYWYYNHIQYTSDGSSKDIDATMLPDAIKDKDAIVLLYNVPNCEKFGNGLIDELYTLLKK